MYVDRPLKEYLDDLAAKKPAPGGGSAAALAAAIGTSLMSMAANFTIGKPKHKETEEKIAAILAKSREYDSKLRSMVDEDVLAYARLSKGLKELAGAGNDAARDGLYKGAIEPPFLVCEIAHNCMKLCKELAACGNENLITDVAAAAVMLESAYMCAKFNVYINLGYVKDLDYIARVHKVISPLEEEMPELKVEILEMCEDVIKKMSGA